MTTTGELTLGRKVVLGAGVLLFVDLFLPWQSWDLGPFGTRSVSGWHGFWGVLLGLLTVAIVAWTGARVAGIALPQNLPDGTVTLALGLLIAMFALIENIADDYSAWGSYLGVLLALVVTYGGYRVFVESGEQLPGSAPASDERDR